jgi:hypothetical protein
VPANAQQTTYTQTNRPVWASSKDAFLRVWRALHAEGAAGLSQAGKLRMMTAAAADEYLRRQNARRRPTLLVVPPAPRDPATEMRKALGLKVKP